MEIKIFKQFDYLYEYFDQSRLKRDILKVISLNEKYFPNRKIKICAEHVESYEETKKMVDLDKTEYSITNINTRYVPNNIKGYLRI